METLVRWSCMFQTVDGDAGKDSECDVSPTDSCVSTLGPQLFGDSLEPFGGDA